MRKSISLQTLLTVVLLATTIVAQPNPQNSPKENVSDKQLADLIQRAQAGDVDSQIALGDRYREAKHYAKAVKWYRKAADQGDAFAQGRLGLMYELGYGLPIDYTQAAKWYRKAADQGDAHGQELLGSVYQEGGKGFPQDYKEAVKWYMKAAEQGHSLAQSRLGGMYNRGEGVPQDYIHAYMWVGLAAASLPVDLQKAMLRQRDKIAAKMTPQQIHEAERLTREWKPKSSK